MDCYSSDSSTAVLEVFADNGISYLLPYAQFLRAERLANPALEKEPDAPPEKMLLHFGQAEVVILGSGLKFVADGIRKYDLKYVKSADRLLTFNPALGAHIAAITVTLTKENV
jgi:hypothetical protein